MSKPSTAEPRTAEPRVVVLISPNCHLCDDALAIVGGVCDERAVTWVARQLADLDAATQEQWREFTPVVIVDDVVQDVFRTTAARLREVLG